MLTRIALPAFVLTLVANAGLALADGEQWTTNFEEAKATAKKENKSILMDFTGSDWCYYCIQLDKKVFSKEVFQKEAPKHFVLLKVDYPRDKSKQSKEEIAQNEKLKATYGYAVSGYPTVLLTDAEGRPFAKKTGYGGTEAAKYVEELKSDAAIRKQRDDLLTKAENAEGIAKAKLLDQAVSLIDSELGVSAYSDIIDQIVALDSQGKAGLKSKYEEVLKLAKVKDVVAEIRRSGNLDESLAKINKLITDLDLKGEVLQEAMYYKGYIQFQKGDKDASKTTLEAALKLAPESKMGKQIERILENAFK